MYEEEHNFGDTLVFSPPQLIVDLEDTSLNGSPGLVWVHVSSSHGRAI